MKEANKMEHQKLNDQLQRLQVREDIYYNRSPRSRSPYNDKGKEINVKRPNPMFNNNGGSKPHIPVSSKAEPLSDANDLLHVNDLVKCRWRVLKKIGGGGFGEIYEAVDTQKPGSGSSDILNICSLCASSRSADGGYDMRFPRSSTQSSNRMIVAEKSRLCKDCGREFYPSLQRYPSEDYLESVDSGNCSGNSEKLDTPPTVAIKTESNTQPKQMLRMEVAVLRRLQGRKDFCELLGCGKNTRINYIIMTLQGENLSEIRKKSAQGTFSISTSLRLVSKCLTAIEALHMAGFLHRDVKPSNFAIRRDDPSEICILDFGLVRQFTVTGSTTVPRPPRSQAGFRGTVRYASANAHLSRELGRHDDIWSLYYMLVEFLCGRLPWRRLRDKELVGKMKVKTDAVKLGIDAGLPRVVAEAWIGQLTNLSYFAIPVYSELRSVISTWLENHEVRWSDPYDWNVSTQVNKRNNVEESPFVPLFKRQSKRSTQEGSYFKRGAERKAFASTANLAACKDSTDAGGLFNSTQAVAEDAVTNQHRTQVPGCITMASENNLNDDDAEASDNMDQHQVLMKSHGDLRNLGETIEIKQPPPVKKQSQGLGSAPIKPPMSSDNPNKYHDPKAEIQRLISNYAAREAVRFRSEENLVRASSINVHPYPTILQTSFLVRSQFNKPPSIDPNARPEFRLPAPPPSSIIRSAACQLQAPIFRTENAGLIQSLVQSNPEQDQISNCELNKSAYEVSDQISPKPKPRHFHVTQKVTEGLQHFSEMPMQQVKQENGWLCRDDRQINKSQNLQSRRRLWKGDSVTEDANLWLTDICQPVANNDLPENKPLVSGSSFLKLPKTSFYETLDENPGWLPVIDGRGRSSSYENEDASTDTQPTAVVKEDQRVNSSDAVCRYPLQQPDSIHFTTRQALIKRPGMPKFLNRNPIQLLPQLPSAQSTK